MLLNRAESHTSAARFVTKMKQVGRGGWYPVKQSDATPGMPTGAGASG